MSNFGMAVYDQLLAATRSQYPDPVLPLIFQARKVRKDRAVSPSLDERLQALSVEKADDPERLRA